MGDNATQLNVFFNGTWTDGVAPPPLIGVQGTIDSPYRGLNAFEEQDAGLFFGREMAATDVLDLMSQRLAGRTPLVISGVSGAGKSSLLRAGLLAGLHRNGLAFAPEARSWPCLVFTPGSEPLGELAARIAPLAGTDAGLLRHQLGANPAGFALTAKAAALARVGDCEAAAVRPRGGQRRTVLVVDQCEQLFTRCKEEGIRQAFITALHAAAASDDDSGPAAVVVLVVRADFEARLADYQQLALAVQGRYLLTPMRERQLRMAITMPAVAAGSAVDPDLVQTLLEETRRRAPSPTGAAGAVNAGVLPLLSHALDQAWRSRTGHTLTLADYERVGGIEGAVARSAEGAYNLLTPAQQTAARQVFTLLAVTSSDGTISSSRISRPSLTSVHDPDQARDIETVLDTFAAARLLTLAAGTVELSHETVLTAWPLYRDTWLAETHAESVIRARLGAASEEWDRAARSADYLYRGSLLEAAASTAGRIATDPRHALLNPVERDFLKASRRSARRRVRRGRMISAILMVLVLGLALVAGAVVRANQATTGQRDYADSQLLASESLSGGSADATTSQIESLAAWAVNHSPQAEYAMLTAAARPQIATLPVAAPQAISAVFSPDGEILATLNSYGNVQLWNRVTLRPVGMAFARGIANSAIAFSPDGNILVTGSTSGVVRLWDAASGRQIGPPMRTGADTYVTSLAFNPNGTKLAVVAGRAQLWDIATHRLVWSLTPPGGAPSIPPAFTTAAFSPNGKILATGAVFDGARLWDVATGQEIGGPLGYNTSGKIYSVAFSPSGKVLAVGGLSFSCSCFDAYGGIVSLWNVTSGQRIGQPLANGTIGPVNSLAFSPDGGTLASGGEDGTVRQWDIGSRTGTVLNSSRASQVYSVAYSPDGGILATASSDGMVRLWAPSRGQPDGPPIPGGSAGSEVAFSPDGILVTGGGYPGSSPDGIIQFWNVKTRRQVGRPITGSGTVTSIALSPNGKLLASCCFNQAIQLWNTTTHREVGPPIPGGGPLAFSPSGALLAAWGSGGTPEVILWSVATHRQAGKPLAIGGDETGALAFSPDGQMLAVTAYSENASDGGIVQFWSTATHRQLGKPILNASIGAVNTLAFNPSGTLLATGDGQATSARLWYVANRQEDDAPLTGGVSDTDGIYAVAFSPDGTILAGGSADGDITLWDVATGQQIGDPLIDANWPSTIAFSPDGTTLAAGVSGGYADKLWDVSYLHDVQARLCSAIGGTLTRAEWTQYVPQGPGYRSVCP